MEEYNDVYHRTVDKYQIPTCNIMGVRIAAVNMEWLLEYLKQNLGQLKGDYICVSNVHTTVLSYEDPDYCKIQNNGLMALPDGGPLSTEGKRRGFPAMNRITGPDLMEKVFEISRENGYRHFFYGSTEETRQALCRKLKETYPGIQIVGSYSPPFRNLEREEDEKVVKKINESDPDFVWIGLGAPKQEIFMSEHYGRISGLMIGVGAGFAYHAGQLKRAPRWMQKNNLEWLYRLMQEPGRLVGRYGRTNTKFIWNACVRGR